MASKLKQPSHHKPDLDGKTIYAVIETPKGNRNKFKFDPDLKQFTLDKVLPAGFTFPYDYGFIPETMADDGDPIDVLLLMDESAFPGCVIPARLVGVIEAKQTEADGRKVRNDRLIAVAEEAHNYEDIRTLKDINRGLLKELEHFFVSYHQTMKTRFSVLDIGGPKRAQKLVKAAVRQYRRRLGKK